MAEPLHPQSLTDEQILRSVDSTVRDVLLPAIPEEEEAWARAVAVQLVGLVRYAIERGEDRTEARVAELTEVLAAMADNEIVAASWDGERSQRSVMAATGAALVAAIDRHDPAAVAVRRELRTVVVRQLDDELSSTARLVDAFRGRLDE